uniref:Right handed beta helix domain-containing protein n=1 Tax=Hanusia phi TaxID=3032 RepID=A0A7S0HRQ2_9CRYP|mmetsp:Transcript_3408/g.8262  ORF Transcript_3408/g.8262 Transcript_3408/m.8262 type:complete len:282 (+) Transcript_3408:218-1063(+)
MQGYPGASREGCGGGRREEEGEAERMRIRSRLQEEKEGTGAKGSKVVLRMWSGECRSHPRCLVCVVGSQTQVELNGLTILLYGGKRPEEGEGSKPGDCTGKGEGEGGGGADERGGDRRDGEDETSGKRGDGGGKKSSCCEEEFPNIRHRRKCCLEILSGKASLSKCTIFSEEHDGITVLGSAKALLVDTQVSMCGKHGVSALHGALVEAENCKISENKLSGFNAIGKVIITSRGIGKFSNLLNDLHACACATGSSLARAGSLCQVPRLRDLRESRRRNQCR